MSTLHQWSIALLFLALSAAAAPAAEKKNAAPPAAPATAPAPVSDTRDAIVLTSSERNELLKGMRTYLEALQGITEALAKNNSATLAASARQAGAKMLLDVPVFVPVKMPVQFSALSLATHQKFDELATHAEKSASRSEVLTSLAEIMTNCTSCHAAYRVVSAP